MRKIEKDTHKHLIDKLMDFEMNQMKSNKKKSYLSKSASVGSDCINSISFFIFLSSLATSSNSFFDKEIALSRESNWA